MKELLLKSDNLITEAINIRNRREDFAVVVDGNQALKLYKVVPYYERYRDTCRKREPGRIWQALSFGWRGLRRPIFWCVCTLADAEAKQSKFVYAEERLRAEFYFGGAPQIIGTDYPDTLSSRNNLAGAYRSAGQLDDAITLYQSIWADSEQILGPDHLDTLRSRCNLAYTYWLVGRLDDAIPMFQAVLADTERVFGTDHPFTLNSRNNLAGAYESAGRLEDAIPIFEANLADQERVLDLDHANTLASRNNLAGAYESAGRLDEAISLYQTTLAGYERVLGPDHPDTLNSRSNLAVTLWHAGRTDKALAEMERAAKLAQILGADHEMRRIINAWLDKMTRNA
jgi:tetratricopeptide (TPR) repeat protein